MGNLINDLAQLAICLEGNKVELLLTTQPQNKNCRQIKAFKCKKQYLEWKCKRIYFEKVFSRVFKKTFKPRQRTSEVFKENTPIFCSNTLDNIKV